MQTLALAQYAGFGSRWKPDGPSRIQPRSGRDVSFPDSDDSHVYRLDFDNATANRTFTVNLGDADRTLTISGNAVLNQDVSSSGTPTFGTVTLTPGAAPAGVEGKLYANSIDHSVYFYDGTSWVDLTSGGGDAVTVTVAANDSQNKADADYVCDGVADEVTIQAAIDSLTSGGTVQLLEGTFVLAAAVVFDEDNDNVHVRGAGEGTTIISGALADSVPYFDFNVAVGTTLSYVTLAGFTVDGTLHQATTAFDSGLIRDTSSGTIDHLTLDRLTIISTGKYDHGIVFNDDSGAVNHLRITHNTITNTTDALTYYGIEVRKPNSYTWITDNRITVANDGVGDAYNPLALYGHSSHFHVSDNVITMTGVSHAAIAISPGSHGVVSGNTITTQAVEGGIEVESSTSHGGTDQSYDIIVSDNVVTSSNGPGIYVRNSGTLAPHDIAVVDNLIMDAPVGVHIFAGTDITVHGNAYENCTTDETLDVGVTTKPFTADHLRVSPGSAPTATEGAVYANSTDHNIYFYDGTDWVDLTITDHGALTGLLDDDHTQYALLAGRTGDQTLYGGTGASQTLTLAGTSNATPGDVILNPNGGNVGIGTTGPLAQQHTVAKDATTIGTIIQAAATPTADVFQIRDSAGTPQVVVDKDFHLQITSGNINVPSGNGSMTVTSGYLLFDGPSGVFFRPNGNYLFYVGNFQLKTWDNVRLTFGNDNDFSIGYSNGTDYLQFVQGAALGSNIRMVIDSAGNVGIRTTTFDATAAGVLAIGNGTAPAAGTADQSYIYAKDVAASSEMHVMDEAGNETQISPHDPETGEWIFYSRNVKTGREVRVNMEDLVREVERLSGKKFMTERYLQAP